MVANAPIIFKVEPQELTAQPTMEAELVAVARTMKEEAVFCSNMMSELGFGESFRSVPRCISITRRRCTSPATVPTSLAQSISR